MELSDLKKLIINNNKIKFPLNFVDNKSEPILIKSYIEAIANIHNLEIFVLDNLNDVMDITQGMFYDNSYLFVYYCDNIENPIDENILLYPLIIVSNKKIDNIESVTFAKVLDWQVVDFIHKNIPGLDEDSIKWLCQTCDYNLERLLNESNKINIFPKADQKLVFRQILSDNGYSDINNLNIFNLSNAIVRRDNKAINSILQTIETIDAEATGLVTILLRQFLNLLNIQLCPNITAKQLNMEEKQFKAIRYNCNKYSNESLMDIYKFLSSFDCKLKSGLLDVSNTDLITYLITNIINKK